MIQNMICISNSHGLEQDLVIGQTYKVDVFADGWCDVRNDDLSIKIEGTHSSRFEDVERYALKKRRSDALAAFQSLSIDEQEALLRK